MELGVMTFNLRYNEPRDGENAWPNRLERVVGVIREHNPLIIGTQEGLPDMLEDLSNELPDYQYFGKVRSTGGEHNAIFYKKDELTLLEEETFWLSETPSIPESKSWDSSLPRICTIGHFKKDDREFLFYNTHLDHVGQQARENGIQLILQHMKKNNEEKQLPLILTGDFNSGLDNKVISILAEGNLVSCYNNMTNVGATFHNFTGNVEGTPIDYIYFSKNVDLVSVKVDRNKYNGGYPTDHYPVWAKLSI